MWIQEDAPAPRAFILRPIHRADVERGVFVETPDAFLRKPDPFLGRDRRIQKQFFRRVVDPRAVKVKIRSNAFECSGTIKHDRTKPRGMGARAHDADVALVPIPLEERPRF